MFIKTINEHFYSFEFYQYIYLLFTGCGSEITTPGTIKSPISFDKLYGGFGYPRNSNCTWIIRAPPEQIVQLRYV